jgi:hypothetical protein
MSDRTCGQCKHWYTVSSLHLMYVEGIYDNWRDHGACDEWPRVGRHADASRCKQFEPRKPYRKRTNLSGRIPPME